MECNILHRDISVGNILLPNYEEGNGEGGFIHDFDYGQLPDTASIDSIAAKLREMTVGSPSSFLFSF
jgi:hypothetical protein